jgi:spermidine synthase
MQTTRVKIHPLLANFEEIIMPEPLLDRDATIFYEMMAHTPLFAHRKPQTIAILYDDTRGISQEVSKHIGVSRIMYNLAEAEPSALDILIIAKPESHTHFGDYFIRLHADGILIQLAESPFQLEKIKFTQQKLKATGFHDVLALQFPQPNFASGWRSAVMAIKQGTIKRPREKDIFNKEFSTHYYNLDVHKAAFALPEFMRLELEI